MRGSLSHSVLLIATSAIVGVTSAPCAAAQAGDAPDTAQSNAFWQLESPTTTPPAMRGSAMVFDGSVGRVILFGGEVSGHASNRTWSWDGKSWIELHPKHHPPARMYHAMAYDPIRGETVLFGGEAGGEVVDDTWVFSDGDWTQADPASAPWAVEGAAMAFDLALRQLILFGGADQSQDASNTMWRWDGTNWMRMTPTTLPPPREAAGFAYDWTRRALVLFSGYDNGGSGPSSFLRDTWTWDGTAWTELALLRSPPPRMFPAMTTLARRPVVFGGRHVRDLADTWILNANGWRKLPVDPSPAARQMAGAVWDPASNAVLLFGGSTDSGYLDDTWTLHRRLAPG